MANKGNSDVVLLTDHGAMKASLVNLRNVFKGKIDVQVLYRCGEHQARIIKTDFKE
jgi:lipopolysaccharide biosynthesis regulator YciM